MKTPVVIGAVAAVHVMALVVVVFSQGCGTTRPHAGPVPEPKMPPVEVDNTLVKLPTPSPAPTPVPPAPAEVTEYVIREGESLSSIASRSGVRLADLIALNGIKDANRVQVGQRLILPGKVTVKPSRSTPSASSSGAAVPGLDAKDVYEVKAGDALSKIAVAHGVTMADIKKANQMTGDQVRIGQKLRIPQSTIKSPVKPAGSMEAVAPTVNPSPAGFSVPVVAPVQGASVVAPNAPLAVRDSGHIHKVEPDETNVYQVAGLWAVSVEDIRKLNKLTSDTLRPGDSLRIPASE
ncbi:MAG: hypothetical protein A2498_07255 [Lentisphaerae bacterium RIFOXYC12_FULL_60_16]|nr:MAG: hypothetical protein A2498_07255 [Lentisphaerae bacterium RIFOXYC12_FULL_60_16]OGV86475.1 MAG: hypothetical protein A2340_09015 [Lentisphaerae bacterium RIFOXYB12_FULL_60_10]